MKHTLIGLMLCSAASVATAEIMVPVHLVNAEGVGESIGTITVTQATHGIQLKPDLRDLPPGQHGFHLHENGSCESTKKNGETTPAGAAGSHYDPDDSGKHGAPWGDGHKGDLPSLSVNTNGTSTQPLAAPRLTLEEFYERALVIHSGGDNYSDYPDPLGGGGPRIACGVVPKPSNGISTNSSQTDNDLPPATNNEKKSAR